MTPRFFVKNMRKESGRRTMQKTRKVLVSILILSLIFSFSAVPVFATAPLEINAKAAILVDNNSGRILYEQNIDEQLEPASTSKMMTEYLVLEHVMNGSISWDDKVTASEYAGWMGINGGSAVYLAEGERHTVRELFTAVAIASANDAAVALAEHISGSESDFARLMNQKAKEMGLTGTYFVNASGYPTEDMEKYQSDLPGTNLMTTRDAAILAWYLLNDYPQILETSSKARLEFRPGQVHTNVNFMLPELIYGYDGLDGLKTGYTRQAGYCFTGTAKKNDIRLISVVFGTTSLDKRAAETRKLLNYGFNNYENIQLIGANESVSGSELIPLSKGKEKEVAAVSEEALYLLIKRGDRDSYQAIVEYDEKLEAPIAKGTQIGDITYNYTDKGESIDNIYLDDRFVDLEKVKLVANESVEKSNVITLFFRSIGDTISKVYNVVVDAIIDLFKANTDNNQ